ncbi:MAG: universal stress protein [Psychroflexus sp.]|jgi:nucleotide-binding universal stress UspA family protein|nr:universal stress protein [Psychroflexus sp.]MDR9448651.1 universal stress protein [Psychroflexus sp.]
MKKILVPTDFSDQAENALRVAAQVARNYDCEIFLLHMLELPLDLINPANNDSGSSDLPESIFFMKLAHQKFTQILNQDYLEGLTVHETVEFHEAFDGIMEISKKYECDLIIMGSNGARGAKDVFIGSNTEKVVRHSDIPVIVIKKPIEKFEVNKMMYATNLARETGDSFKEAKKFADKFEAEIEVVFINTSKKFKTSEEIDKRKELYYHEIGLDENEVPFIVRDDHNTENGIINYAKNFDVDLISIGTHGRKGINRFLNGSISEDLVNHAKLPVVTFKI